MSDDDITAYHESGHAVMAVHLGGVVNSMSLRPESTVDWDDAFPRHGDTVVAWPRNVSPKQHAIREAHTALAGPVSETIYTGDNPLEMIHAESAADWHMATQHAMSLFPTQDNAVAFIVDSIDQLNTLLRGDEVWAAVAALADELLVHDQLESEQIHDTVGFWLRRT